MACRCTGVRINRCSCEYFGTTNSFPYRNGQKLLFIAQKHNDCYRSLHPDPTKYSIFVMLFEKLYDKCTQYNLRYCKFKGLLANSNDTQMTYIRDTLKDLVILCCFLLANFVVLLTIVTKIIVQMGFVGLKSVQWIRRYYLNNTNHCRANEITPALLKELLSRDRCEISS